jgi:acyl-CoA thioester hydrolase
MSAAASATLYRTDRIVIENSYIDYNRHLNAGFYYVIFDKMLDQVFIPWGLGPDYIKQRNLSTMTLEAHVCYVREVLQTDPIRMTLQVLDADAKRIHTYCELVHETEGWVAASAESIHIHVDMNTRRSAPWPADIMANLDAAKTAHAGLPRPERAGRKIGIVRKA